MRKQSLAASIAESSAAEARTSSDRSTVKEKLRQSKQMPPLVVKQAHQQSSLRDEGYVSPATATHKNKELVAANQKLATQQSSWRSAEAAIAQARSRYYAVPLLR